MGSGCARICLPAGQETRQQARRLIGRQTGAPAPQADAFDWREASTGLLRLSIKLAAAHMRNRRLLAVTIELFPTRYADLGL